MVTGPELVKNIVEFDVKRLSPLISDEEVDLNEEGWTKFKEAISDMEPNAFIKRVIDSKQTPINVGQNIEGYVVNKGVVSFLNKSFSEMGIILTGDDVNTIKVHSRHTTSPEWVKALKVGVFKIFDFAGVKIKIDLPRIMDKDYIPEIIKNDFDNNKKDEIKENDMSEDGKDGYDVSQDEMINALRTVLEKSGILETTKDAIITHPVKELINSYFSGTIPKQAKDAFKGIINQAYVAGLMTEELKLALNAKNNENKVRQGLFDIFNQLFKKEGVILRDEIKDQISKYDVDTIREEGKKVEKSVAEFDKLKGELEGQDLETKLEELKNFIEKAEDLNLDQYDGLKQDVEKAEKVYKQITDLKIDEKLQLLNNNKDLIEGLDEKIKKLEKVKEILDKINIEDYKTATNEAQNVKDELAQHVIDAEGLKIDEKISEIKGLIEQYNGIDTNEIKELIEKYKNLKPEELKDKISELKDLISKAEGLDLETKIAKVEGKGGSTLSEDYLNSKGFKEKLTEIVSDLDIVKTYSKISEKLEEIEAKIGKSGGPVSLDGYLTETDREKLKGLIEEIKEGYNVLVRTITGSEDGLIDPKIKKDVQSFINQNPELKKLLLMKDQVESLVESFVEHGLVTYGSKGPVSNVKARLGEIIKLTNENKEEFAKYWTATYAGEQLRGFSEEFNKEIGKIKTSYETLQKSVQELIDNKDNYNEIELEKAILGILNDRTKLKGYITEMISGPLSAKADADLVEGLKEKINSNESVIKNLEKELGNKIDKAKWDELLDYVMNKKDGALYTHIEDVTKNKEEIKNLDSKIGENKKLYTDLKTTEIKDLGDKINGLTSRLDDHYTKTEVKASIKTIEENATNKYESLKDEYNALKIEKDALNINVNELKAKYEHLVGVLINLKLIEDDGGFK